MMNNRYRRVYSGTASFMSSNTFIAWWFSWISKFNIDFRQPCKLCKYNPRYLAADGTKIGINVSHSTVTPIEEPTVDTLIDPCHRRNNRAFISYSQGDQDAKEKSKSRDHLLYHCKRSLYVHSVCGLYMYFKQNLENHLSKFNIISIFIEIFIMMHSSKLHKWFYSTKQRG